jgi:hypothetical protein
MFRTPSDGTSVQSTSLSGPCPTGSLIFLENLSNKAPVNWPFLERLRGCHSVAMAVGMLPHLAASQVGSRLAVRALAAKAGGSPIECKPDNEAPCLEGQK